MFRRDVSPFSDLSLSDLVLEYAHTAVKFVTTDGDKSLDYEIDLTTIESELRNRFGLDVIFDV